MASGRAVAGRNRLGTRHARARPGDEPPATRRQPESDVDRRRRGGPAGVGGLDLASEVCEGVGEGDELAPAAVDGDGWADPVEDGAPPTLDCGAGRNCRVPTANRTAIALTTPIHSGTG